jgi:hypothetical protein
MGRTSLNGGGCWSKLHTPTRAITTPPLVDLRFLLIRLLDQRSYWTRGAYCNTPPLYNTAVGYLAALPLQALTLLVVKTVLITNGSGGTVRLVIKLAIQQTALTCWSDTLDIHRCKRNPCCAFRLANTALAQTTLHWSALQGFPAQQVATILRLA